MTIRYLLDTNILSDLIRHPQGKVRNHIGRLGEASIATSIIVACELRFGAEKRGSTALTQRVEQILSSLTVLQLKAPADKTYGKLRATLETEGRVIGPNDLLIAAQALAEDLVLVTDNEKEFRRCEGLAVENWLAH